MLKFIKSSVLSSLFDVDTNIFPYIPLSQYVTLLNLGAVGRILCAIRDKEYLMKWFAAITALVKNVESILSFREITYPSQIVPMESAALRGSCELHLYISSLEVFFPLFSLPRGSGAHIKLYIITFEMLIPAV